MKRFAHYLLILFAFGDFGLMASAASVSDVEALYRLGKYDEAYVLAQSMSNEQQGDVNFDFYYGISARRAGHPQIAIFALERVIMQNPADALSTYERGLALLDVNDIVSARKAFETVLELDTTDELKANARALMFVGNAPNQDDKRPLDIALAGAFDVGFNSNVNGGRPGLEEFPLQGPEVKDGFANLGLAFLMKHHFTKANALFLSLSTNNRKNFRSVEWDYNAFGGRTGIELGAKDFLFRIPFEAEVILIDYAFARVFAQIGIDVRYLWNANTTTSFSVHGRHKGYVDSANNHFTFPISLQHEAYGIASGLDLYARLSYGPYIGYALSPGPKVNALLSSIVELTWEVARSHHLIPSIQFNYFRFPISTQSADAREDHNILTQLGYEWRIDSHWTLCPSFAYTYNASTDEEQRYMRYQVQAGIRYEL